MRSIIMNLQNFPISKTWIKSQVGRTIFIGKCWFSKPPLLKQLYETNNLCFVFVEDCGVSVPNSLNALLFKAHGIQITAKCCLFCRLFITLTFCHHMRLSTQESSISVTLWKSLPRYWLCFKYLNIISVDLFSQSVILFIFLFYFFPHQKDVWHRRCFPW